MPPFTPYTIEDREAAEQIWLGLGQLAGEYRRQVAINRENSALSGYYLDLAKRAEATCLQFEDALGYGEPQVPEHDTDG